MLKSNPQQNAQKIEQLKYEKEQVRINDTLEFLQMLHSTCKNEYRKLGLTDYLKRKSLPYIMTAVIAEKGLVKSQGISLGKVYQWIGKEPDANLAEEVLIETRRQDNEYNRTKAAERRGQKSTINVGNKRFIRIIKPEAIKEPPIKHPSTPTEIETYRILKLVKTLLTTGQHVMDFSGMCDHKHISLHVEFALLNTVVKKTSAGFIWDAGEVDYEMVRKVIDYKKAINPDQMFEKNVIRQSDFIKPKEEINMLTPQKEFTNPDPQHVVNRVLAMLTELQHETKHNEIKSINSLLRKHKLSDNYFPCIKDLKIVEKVEGVYKWLVDEPTLQLALNINAAFNQKAKDYYHSRKNPSEPKTITPAATMTDTSQSAEIVKAEPAIFTVTTPKSEPKPVLNEILTNLADEKKQKINKLAEKFALAGNYEMAERLLDQIL